ncbi:tyrosine recombinase XerC [Novosphingobium sp.]|uniref:site-specific integrase n=1 Tax=Novosphingobium sp. TaxID=1874826 RepID=UPI0038BD1D26
MSGLHVVRKPAAAGLDRWYVYAWRGGPCIHKAAGPRPVIGPELLSAAMKARAEVLGETVESLDDVIDEYRAAPEFTGLAASTQRDYRLWLDRISGKFGNAPIGAFEDQRMRREIIAWRDEWAHQPRTADKASVTMATLLGWAQERGIITVNVAARIKQLHHVNKADQVWEARHWLAVEQARKPAKAGQTQGDPLVPPHIMDALHLARLTGLRLGDLVRVSWEQLGEKAIVIDRTRKRKSRAVIPVFPDLRKLLDQLAAKIPQDKDGNRPRTGAILRNSRGGQWTESGLESSWHKSKPEGFDRVLHDLRGTFVTFLAGQRLTDQEIARIVGWTAQRIAEIRARYVDEERVIVSLVNRLSA